MKLETKPVTVRDVPDNLLRRAKSAAALAGVTLKDFVVKAIQSYLERGA